MSQWWAISMLLSGGLFVGGVALIAWERVPAWRATDLVDFRTGFAHTLRRVDRLQPALLVVCLSSTIERVPVSRRSIRRLQAASHETIERLESRRLLATVLFQGTAAGERGGIAGPVAWRSPAPERRRAGLLRPGRRRHRRVRTPTTTVSQTDPGLPGVATGP